MIIHLNKINHSPVITTETETGDYCLVNATIGTSITRKGKTIFSVHFSGMNLGDVAYQNHLTRLKYVDVNNVTGRTVVFNTWKKLWY